MNEAITVGMVVKAALVIGGILGLLGLVVFVLSILADAFKH